MKKFKLQRGFIAGALGATMVLSGCSKNIDETVANNVVTTEAITVGETTEVTAGRGSALNVNDGGIKIYDANMPITAEIEQVELENSGVGYKLPIGYLPYNVDEEYNAPGLLPIIEQTDDYYVFALATIKSGNEILDSSFDGAIGVYEPYFKLLYSKMDILNRYDKEANSDIDDDYSFATFEDQEILEAIDVLYNEIVEEYNASKGVSLKR